MCNSVVASQVRSRYTGADWRSRQRDRRSQSRIHRRAGFCIVSCALSDRSSIIQNRSLTRYESAKVMNVTFIDTPGIDDKNPKTEALAMSYMQVNNDVLLLLQLTNDLSLFFSSPELGATDRGMRDGERFYASHDARARQKMRSGTLASAKLETLCVLWLWLSTLKQFSFCFVSKTI